MIKYFVILLAQLVAIPVAGFWRANGENARIANQEIIGDAAPVTIDLRPEVYADLPAPVRRYFDYAFSSLRMRFSFRNRSFSRSRSASRSGTFASSEIARIHFPSVESPTPTSDAT
jgi:hypothetical protein